MYKNNNKGVSKTQFNSKRKMKSLFASLSVLSSIGVAVGVGASVSNSYSSNNELNISQGDSTKNSTLSFSSSSSLVNSNSSSGSNQTIGGSSSDSSSSSGSSTITPSQYNKTESLMTDKGTKQDVLVSTLTTNNRSFMPILAYSDDQASNYISGRSGSDVQNDDYNGWTKSSYDSTSVDYAWSFSYSATELLTKTFSNVTPTINVLSISLEIAKDDNLTASDIATFINSQSNVSMVKFFEVRDDNVNLLPNLTSNENIKKVQINASTQWKNALTSFPKDLSFPKNTKEIQLYTPDVKSIDPLAIPEDASLISDNTQLTARFENIDLSSHSSLTNDQLQKAVDIVYKTRINERAFQGAFAGGYIYSWNLIGTGITSFNDVVIPKLEDGTGRFYIAYVAVSSSGTIVNGEVNETMKPSNTASNDSQIKEWYDSNPSGWSTVTTVNVSSKEQEISYDVALKEIVGYVNKYPNTNKINIKDVKLANGKTLAELKSALESTFKTLEKTITIVTE